MLVEKATIANLTDDEWAYFKCVTETKCNFIRRTTEKALAEIQETRERNANARPRTKKEINAYMIWKSIQDTAGTVE